MRTLVILAVALTGLSACGNQAGGSPQASATATATASVSASPTASTSASTTTMIQAINFAFQPKTLTVKQGTPVTFQNSDTATHTFTSDSGAFDSGRVPPGQTFSFTFAKVGSFPFHCTIHPSMTGTITVTS